MNKKLLTIGVALMLLFPLSLMVGWLYGKSFQKIYSSSVLVLVDRGRLSLNKELEIIKSPTIVLPVIEKLGLAEEINAQMKQPPTTSDETYAFFVRNYLNVQHFRVPSKLIEIEVKYLSSYKAALIADVIAKQYIKDREERIIETTNNALSPIRKEIEEQKKLIAELNDKVSTAPENISVSNLDKLKSSLEREQKILTLLEDRYQQTVADCQIIYIPAVIVSEADVYAPPVLVKPKKMSLIMLLSGLAGLLPLLAGGILVIVAFATRKPR